jgi:hypothetical protein
MPEIAAMDLFVVPTLAFNLLYGFTTRSGLITRSRRMRQCTAPFNGRA